MSWFDRILRGLHGAGFIKATHVTMSSRAAACWQAALESCGGFPSMNALILLQALLADAECGFVRYLASESVDLENLRARSARVTPRNVSEQAFPALVRKSYEVAPVDVFDRRTDRQVLHTIHWLWGLSTAGSGVGEALQRALSVKGLRKDSELWARWREG